MCVMCAAWMTRDKGTKSKSTSRFFANRSIILQRSRVPSAVRRASLTPIEALRRGVWSFLHKPKSGQLARTPLATCRARSRCPQTTNSKSAFGILAVVRLTATTPAMHPQAQVLRQRPRLLEATLIKLRQDMQLPTWHLAGLQQTRQ